jgi:hypothetical protein
MKKKVTSIVILIRIFITVLFYFLETQKLVDHTDMEAIYQARQTTEYLTSYM